MNKNLLIAKQFYDISISTAQTAVEQAKESGMHFMKAKSEMKHGEFMPAIESLGLNHRTVVNGQLK